MTLRPEPDGPLHVVFIAGFGRSGSTLMDQLLGQVPGITALGETRYVWERGWLADERCGCGQPFHACPYWQRVATDWSNRAATAGGASTVAPRGTPEDLAEASRRTLRPLGYVRRRAHLHGAALERQYRTLREATGALLDSAARVAATRWLVDSSKSPSFASLLHDLPGVEVHLVHLVRDSRAVAFSWQRIKERGQPSGRAHMIRYDPITSSLRWLGNNLVAESLARRSVSYRRVRYEDFVAAPEATLRNILSGVGFPEPATLPFLEGDRASVRPTHSVSGNPSRFADGSVRIRLDEQWRTAIEPASLRIATMLTAPLLRRYGYCLRTRAGGPP